MTLYETVMKLVGPVEAVGETGQDERALENLKELTELVDLLLWKIANTAGTADRPEASMKAIGNHARDFLKVVKEA